MKLMKVERMAISRPASHEQRRRVEKVKEETKGQSQ